MKKTKYVHVFLPKGRLITKPNSQATLKSFSSLFTVFTMLDLLSVELSVFLAFCDRHLSNVSEYLRIVAMDVHVSIPNRFQFLIRNTKPISSSPDPEQKISYILTV